MYIVRPQNINWQDWKYTLFVVFLFTVKTFDVTMQCAETKCRKHWIETPIFKLIFNPFYRFYYQINSIKFYKWVIIKSNVLHRSVSYWESLSCKICVHNSGLKLNYEKGISIQCFRMHLQQVSLHPLHCDVECFDC